MNVLALVVMIVQDRIGLPLGGVQLSHNPAKAKGARDTV